MLSRLTLFTQPNNDKVKMILTAAIKNTHGFCVLGSSDKMADIEKTKGWVFFSQFRYNKPGMYMNKKPWELIDADKTEFYLIARNAPPFMAGMNSATPKV